MIAPYLVFCIFLPWCVASCLAGRIGAWPAPDLFLMLWVYLFLRVPRGAGGFLMWTAGMVWDLCFGGQLGLGGLAGVGLWGLRSLLRLGDAHFSPVPRQPVVEGLVAGMFVALLGFGLGALQRQFTGTLAGQEGLALGSLAVGAWTVLLWWPLCRLAGSTARLFSWNPDWTLEEAQAQ